jgi:hypothetical protein
MPWIALVCLGLVVGGCSFEADYSGVTVTCEITPNCPSPLECRDKLCQEKHKDAAVDDMPMIDMMDGPPPALVCLDEGILVSGVPASGSTSNRTNTMTSFCGGGVQNAKDAVYKITTTAPNKQIMVQINALSAYVLNACMPTPNTAACLGSNPATATAPITVTAAAAGPYFVVVDNLVAGAMGTYTLTVTVN